MQWSSNSWSSTSIIVDYTGSTQWGIELEPNAMQEYLIEVEVPSSTSVGDSTSTTLHCVWALGQKKSAKISL